MRNNELGIDQVMIRKVGGWNLEPIASWQQRPVDEQRELIRGRRARFLAGGSDVPVREAIRALRKDIAGDSTVDALTAPSALAAHRISVPLPGRPLPRSTYRRSVGEHKRWIVTRAESDRIVRLDRRWGRPELAYDWSAEVGIGVLAHDLLCDAIGLQPGDSVPDRLRTRATVEAFARRLRSHLGNRAWELSADDVRWWLHDVDHLEFR